jgi:hypothetical protein
MARTEQRYRDQEAAQLQQHAQAFANSVYQCRLLNQWIPYNNISFGKLVITDGCAQVLFKPRSRQLPKSNVCRCKRTHSLIMTPRPDSTYSSI